jgi:hypothetical protein
VYKNKRVLMEAIFKQKLEQTRDKAIADQFEARRAKNKSMRDRKAVAREARRTSQVSLRLLHLFLSLCFSPPPASVSGSALTG